MLSIPHRAGSAVVCGDVTISGSTAKLLVEVNVMVGTIRVYYRSKHFGVLLSYAFPWSDVLVQERRWRQKVYLASVNT
jgi:hypothetical protein